MSKIDEEQKKTPFLDALCDYVTSSPVPFDVPGHKLGSFVTDLSRKISPEILDYDANAPIGLDNLYHSKTVIKEAEQLAAKACQAEHCLFSVNGTTGGILTIFLSCLDNKDKIILPRNVHKSVINGLIISGAVPVFVSPQIDEQLGIANAVKTSDYIKAMDEHPEAKAVFVINPTYFGICADLKTITIEAHKRNMIVICDEAHGSNFYFSRKLPRSAMTAEADITAVSMHKGSGALTQASFILTKGSKINFYEVKRAFAMLSSTSPNPLLIASLDAARKEMVYRGKEALDNCLLLAEYARKILNTIPGIKVIGKEYKTEKSEGVYDIDLTKLIISVRGLGLYGYDVYKKIRAESNIQLELGEVYVVLALIGPGTTKKHIDALYVGLKKISDECYMIRRPKKAIKYHYSFSQSVVPPREGYDAPSKLVNLKESIGEISSETIMAYPPGIPLIIPGEIITSELIKTIEFYYREGGQVLKDSQQSKIKVIDKDKWYLTDDLIDSLKN